MSNRSAMVNLVLAAFAPPLQTTFDIQKWWPAILGAVIVVLLFSMIILVVLQKPGPPLPRGGIQPRPQPPRRARPEPRPAGDEAATEHKGG
ncbi:MAG: hypothetical protein L0332_12870 [Chloroflexi bacterium]|nr:hypothetical protein [Chloroflexota bacterium]MCI0574823.1 hypothetical protein [Chloroflexota bacterium]MCI0645959.1 hypothetical protein [Chloroflexota bacterium]MCI0727598.1 hypothetical protein [Chloroflexota bacterium]